MGQCWHKARAEGSLEGTISVESLSLSVTAEGPQRCSGEGAPGFAAWSSNRAQSSEYFSARIQEMIERRGEYATAVDAEIKASEVHWSELPEMADSDIQRSAEADKAFFESLRQQYGRGHWNFFRYLSVRGWELGERIAEGAQGAIYEVKRKDESKGSDEWVVKVFKAEAGSLEALHKQWPPGMLKAIQNREFYDFFSSDGSCPLFSGVMLDDGRFGFLMMKYWGDLRKMIDGRMMHNGNQAAPFGVAKGFLIMNQIARGMCGLHRNGIVHRDLKASNVLILFTAGSEQLDGDLFDRLSDTFKVDVADFESSAMTVGTTFWRAPEILNAVKHLSFEPNQCTEKSDVYSFGMTCYEILVGKIPFEGVPSNNYDIVLGGKRPELPSDAYPWIRSMIDRCWHHVPSERPSFHEIVEKFDAIWSTESGCGGFLELLKSRKF